MSNAVQRLEQIEDVTMIKRVNGIWDFFTDINKMGNNDIDIRILPILGVKSFEYIKNPTTGRNIRGEIVMYSQYNSMSYKMWCNEELTVGEIYADGTLEYHFLVFLGMAGETFKPGDDAIEINNMYFVKVIDNIQYRQWWLSINSRGIRISTI